MVTNKPTDVEKIRKRKTRAGLYMDEEQFEALMRLCGFNKVSKNRKGARMVLLEGYTTYEAELMGKMARGAMANTMRRIRKCMGDVQLLHFPAVRLPPSKKTPDAEKSEAKTG